MSNIHYKKGYKYQLAQPFSCKTNITINGPIKNDYITLTPDGEIYILKGYAWDGPSGPTFDTKTFMRSSLVHDAFYQLIREELLDSERRIDADKLLKTMCREDGMNRLRAWYVYIAIKKWGKPFVDPAYKNPEIIAPNKQDMDSKT